MHLENGGQPYYFILLLLLSFTLQLHYIEAWFMMVTLCYLLSECILCKESIAIMKKFDFEILTYSHDFRSPKFINAIFWWCIRVCVYVCVCVWMNSIASKWCIRLSLNLVCILPVTVGRTLLVLVNFRWKVFLQEYKKKFLYIKAYGVKFFEVSQFLNGGFDWAQI